MQVIDNKNILKSYIGDKQIVRKILNGKVVYGSPDFAQYYNIQGYDYYNIVGNPTISNGIVSNFSTSNYLTFPAPDLSTSNNWEIATKVNIPRLTNNYQVFFTGSANHQFVGVDIDGSGRLLAAIGNSSGNGWQIQESSSSWSGTKKTVPLNTDFWTKITFNGSKYSIYYSADGENWEETIYYESTQKIYHDPTNIVSIGIGRMHNSFVCSGSIDLKETYIKIDGKYYFNGNSNYKELLWCNPKVYLINNSDAYINTGVNTISTMNVNTKFTFPDNVVRDLFGSNNFYLTKSSSANKINFGYATSSYKTLGSATKTPVNSICEAYFKGSEVGVNGLKSTIERNFDANEIQLFKKHSRTGKNWRGKLYYLDLLDNNTLIRKFVPVPQGLKIGSFTVPYNSIFDIVTQTFYEKQGTGYFTWGVDQ